MSAPKLEFYYYEACPFCRYVMDTIENLKVKVEYKHILKEPKNLEKLVNDTGRRTVPCLYIDGVPMHESRDIMAWLESNVENLEKV